MLPSFTNDFGWYYAGDTPNTGTTRGLVDRVAGALPLVYNDTPLYMFGVGNPTYMSEIDLSPWVGSRRALVRLVASGFVTNVYFRPKGSYLNDGNGSSPDIDELVPYAGGSHWGTRGVTAGNDRSDPVTKQSGGVVTVMTDAEGKVEVSNWNGAGVTQIYVWLESYHLFNSSTS